LGHPVCTYVQIKKKQNILHISLKSTTSSNKRNAQQAPVGAHRHQSRGLLIKPVGWSEMLDAAEVDLKRDSWKLLVVMLADLLPESPVCNTV